MLCTKNYENLSIIVKVTAKKSLAPFFLDTVYILLYGSETCTMHKRDRIQSFHMQA